ncbi:MAG: alpha/beta fold hydrolase, partial [Chloroflexi bacterium]|nr:alpha/beta fold hydrolase [Chloroflexota bacterium]
ASEIPTWLAGGPGQTIILIHGAGGDRRDWTPIMPALSAYYRVYAPDLIGFGESPRDEITYNLKIFRDFIVGFMDELGIQNATLIGHSLGGRISLEVASSIPERISRLVLIAPLGFGQLAILGRIISTSAWAIHKAARIALPYPDLDLELNDHENGIFDKIRQPTLLIWGSRDIYFPASHGWRALRTLPNAQLKIYNGAGHSPHTAYPEHFTSDVHRFISEG